MQVAGELENGYPAKLGQEALAERAGIARSTVAKYLGAKDSDESLVNPDLETVCKLASALNVPPALLLMTPSDWSKLAQAITDAAASVQDSTVQHIVTELARGRSGSARRGEAGLRVAERLGVYRHRSNSISDTQDVPAHWLEAQTEARRRSQLGILTATALPPIGDLNTEQQTILLSLCVILGASTNVK
jgi:transcriptional regulator with XRE-family HTH domain